MKVKVDIETSSYNCECCGWFTNSDATFTLPDGSVYKYCHDGHMGGGNWDGADSSLYISFLADILEGSLTVKYALYGDSYSEDYGSYIDGRLGSLLQIDNGNQVLITHEGEEYCYNFSVESFEEGGEVWCNGDELLNKVVMKYLEDAGYEFEEDYKHFEEEGYEW